MKKSIIFVLIAFFSFSINSFSQYKCYTNHKSINTLEEEAFNQYVINFKQNNGHLNKDLKIIPVIIHVIYRNNADSLEVGLNRIESQLEATNKQLRRQNADTFKTREIFKAVAADCDIIVCLAKKLPDGSDFSGIIYHKYPNYNHLNDLTGIINNTIIEPNKYLNVWIAPDEEGGAATFPWERTSTYDGFWVGSKWFGTFGSNLSTFMNEGATFTHELAHYLGVYHTFHDGFMYLGNCSLVNDPNIGDRCADTPLDWSMPFSAEQCDDGFRYCNAQSHIIAQTENYMYYNQDSCTNMFSLDQRARMRACLNGLRSELVSISNLINVGIDCVQDLPTDNKKPNNNNLINIFPNPFNESISIDYLDLTNGKTTIRIFNNIGQNIFKQTESEFIRKIDLNHLSDGIYFITITVDEVTITHKIIKQ